MRSVVTLCTNPKVLLSLGLAFLVCACVPSMSPHSSPRSGGAEQTTATLPPIDIVPPAKFTKGAPEYTMQFHTTASNNFAHRMARLRMISHPEPVDGASPKAYHMIPAGMQMGNYLPLLPPVRGSGEHKGGERPTIKHYWGCDDTIRKGQPRVQGGGTVSDPGKSGTYAASSALKPGWVEVEWPNRDDSRTVPNTASLVGEHFVHGNFLPHIRFSMDSKHDFMEALSVKAESTSLKDAIPISWNKLPGALGYHVHAVAFNTARKEMTTWSSSEKGDRHHVGYFLPTPQVKKYINEKVILPADRDRCVIPKGIFSEGDNVAITVTAWGEDYWASQPARPAGAPQNWKPDWAVKGQFLSTGHLMLGQSGGAHSSSGAQPAHQGGATAPSRPGLFGMPF